MSASTQAVPREVGPAVVAPGTLRPNETCGRIGSRREVDVELLAAPDAAAYLTAICCAHALTSG